MRVFPAAQFNGHPSSLQNASYYIKLFKVPGLVYSCKDLTLSLRRLAVPFFSLGLSALLYGI